MYGVVTEAPFLLSDELVSPVIKYTSTNPDFPTSRI